MLKASFVAQGGAQRKLFFYVDSIAIKAQKIPRISRNEDQVRP